MFFPFQHVRHLCRTEPRWATQANGDMTDEALFKTVPVYSGSVLLGHVHDAKLTNTCLTGAFHPAIEDPRFIQIVECAAEIDGDDTDYYVACDNWVAACQQIRDVSVMPGSSNRKAESFTLDSSWNAEIALDIFDEVVTDLLSE